MAITFKANGSITFQAEDGSGATQTIAAGTPQATWLPQYNTFQAAHAAPVVFQPELVILPQTDPGIPNALFLTNNTLKVSQGTATAVTIGATGATGLGVAVL